MISDEFQLTSILILGIAFLANHKNFGQKIQSFNTKQLIKQDELEISAKDPIEDYEICNYEFNIPRDAQYTRTWSFRPIFQPVLMINRPGFNKIYDTKRELKLNFKNPEGTCATDEETKLVAMKIVATEIEHKDASNAHSGQFLFGSSSSIFEEYPNVKTDANIVIGECSARDDLQNNIPDLISHSQLLKSLSQQSFIIGSKNDSLSIELHNKLKKTKSTQSTSSLIISSESKTSLYNYENQNQKHRLNGSSNFINYKRLQATHGTFDNVYEQIIIKENNLKGATLLGLVHALVENKFECRNIIFHFNLFKSYYSPTIEEIETSSTDYKDNVALSLKDWITDYNEILYNETALIKKIKSFAENVILNHDNLVTSNEILSGLEKIKRSSTTLCKMILQISQLKRSNEGVFGKLDKISIYEWAKQWTLISFDLLQHISPIEMIQTCSNKLLAESILAYGKGFQNMTKFLVKAILKRKAVNESVKIVNTLIKLCERRFETKRGPIGAVHGDLKSVEDAYPKFLDTEKKIYNFEKLAMEAKLISEIREYQSKKLDLQKNDAVHEWICNCLGCV
ncbi:Ras guanine nucleotide exchange factor domain-containing protein [Rozella allomycis CSF55]|uniref:Ras guanine nucleotide exchange factor domain-containing protein n=1 Tax=Rozella allomycis (strain CSF55) TaxID=988480 RepID=A0A075AR75_ROZAC|nr:Ras guanine nucleotide exchange factor domain-containing protein [Rozella allomycis CSF55]|eukprot:EPZ32738.1 Ras guanine nucleotide exchange factor domain-containing protein [Rozella allomycis CSF55]